VLVIQGTADAITGKDGGIALERRPAANSC